MKKINYESIFVEAIRTFYNKEKDLLDYESIDSVSERCMVSKIAYYIQKKLDEHYDGQIKCDIEYNRNGYDIKRKFNENGTYKNIYPDLIIHERKQKHNNILVAEFKKSDKTSKVNDKSKLKYMTNVLEYRYSYHVILQKDKPIIRKFIDGKLVEV